MKQSRIDINKNYSGVLKKYMTILIVFVLLFTNTNLSLWVEAISDNSVELNKIGERGGYLVANSEMLNSLIDEMKFSGVNGHGFAAERANNLIDFYKGNKVKVLGDDNIKNGPDRLLINRGTGEEVFIQDKYYSTAEGYP